MGDLFIVERKTSVAAPREQVFAQVVDLRKWDDWSPWASMDPKMTKTYEGDPGTVGSSYHWLGNRKVGEGQMTVTEIEAPSRVAIDLTFIKPFKSENMTEILISESGDGAEGEEGSVVTWRMTGKHSWTTKFMGIFRSMDKMVGPDFEKGLTALKKLAEDLPAAAAEDCPQAVAEGSPQAVDEA